MADSRYTGHFSNSSTASTPSLPPSYSRTGLTTVATITQSQGLSTNCSSAKPFILELKLLEGVTLTHDGDKTTFSSSIIDFTVQRTVPMTSGDVNIKARADQVLIKDSVMRLRADNFHVLIKFDSKEEPEEIILRAGQPGIGSSEQTYGSFQYHEHDIYRFDAGKYVGKASWSFLGIRHSSTRKWVVPTEQINVARTHATRLSEGYYTNPDWQLLSKEYLAALNKFRLCHKYGVSLPDSQ